MCILVGLFQDSEEAIQILEIKAFKLYYLNTLDNFISALQHTFDMHVGILALGSNAGVIPFNKVCISFFILNFQIICLPN